MQRYFQPHIRCTDIFCSTARLPCGSRMLISGKALPAVLVKQLFTVLHPGIQEELHRSFLSHVRRFSPLPPLLGRHLELLRLARHLASHLACLRAFLLRHRQLLQGKAELKKRPQIKPRCAQYPQKNARHMLLPVEDQSRLPVTHLAKSRGLFGHTMLPILNGLLTEVGLWPGPKGRA